MSLEHLGRIKQLERAVLVLEAEIVLLKERLDVLEVPNVNGSRPKLGLPTKKNDPN